MILLVRSRLKQALDEAGLSLKALQRTCEARGTPVSYPALHALYSNKSNGVTYPVLGAICGALNCQVNKVIEYLPDE